MNLKKAAAILIAAVFLSGLFPATAFAQVAEDPVLDCMITFETNGGTAPGSITAAQGEPFILPGTVLDGYSFMGWYTDDGTFKDKAGSAGDFYTPEGSITLFARWEIRHFNVTFQDYNGTMLKTETVDWGHSAAAPDVPPREGYRLIGWDKDFGDIKNDLTVTAVYVRQFTVTWKLNNCQPDVQVTADAGSNVQASIPAAPSQKGFRFTGWQYAEGDGESGLAALTKDMTVNASWMRQYTVTWKQDNGEPDMQVTADEGSDVQASIPPVPAKTGYRFTGWQYADGEKEQDLANLLKDMTIQAGWVQQFTAVFLNFDGTVLSAQTVDAGAPAAAPSHFSGPSGMHFTGWDKDFSTITDNSTVQAQYAVNTYRVVFLNWDGALLKVQWVEHGNPAAAPQDPERSGYNFTGWNAAFVQVTDDMTITAQYKKEKVHSAAAAASTAEQATPPGAPPSQNILETVPSAAPVPSIKNDATTIEENTVPQAFPAFGSEASGELKGIPMWLIVLVFLIAVATLAGYLSWSLYYRKQH